MQRREGRKTLAPSLVSASPGVALIDGIIRDGTSPAADLNGVTRTSTPVTHDLLDRYNGPGSGADRACASAVGGDANV